jgi:sulfur carrier protein ThiS
MLALPLEKETGSDSAKGKDDGREFARASAAGPKKIRINKQEYTWNVNTLESLLLKWREQQSDEMYRNMDVSWALVVLNGRFVPPINFRSVAICDGDEISIVLGRGRYR